MQLRKSCDVRGSIRPSESTEGDIEEATEKRLNRLSLLKEVTY